MRILRGKSKSKSRSMGVVDNVANLAAGIVSSLLGSGGSDHTAIVRLPLHLAYRMSRGLLCATA